LQKRDHQQTGNRGNFLSRSGLTGTNRQGRKLISIVCLPRMQLFCFIDLPLSGVVDTLILPYTLRKQLTHGNWFSPRKCEELRQGRWLGKTGHSSRYAGRGCELMYLWIKHKKTPGI
jgi:hypothetical protein